MIDEGDCGAIGGMKIGRGNRSTRRKPALVPLCPPQIRHDQTRAQTADHRGGKPATNRLSYGVAYFRFSFGNYDYLWLIIDCELLSVVFQISSDW
jgi:hypothetical protein